MEQEKQYDQFTDRTGGARVFLLILLSCYFVCVINVVNGDTIRMKPNVVVADSAAVIRLQDTADLSGADVLEIGNLTIITTEELRRRGNFVITLDDLRKAMAARRVNLGRIAFSGANCQVHFAAARELSDRQSKRGGAGDKKEAGVIQPGVWAATVIDDGTLRGQIARLITKQVYQRPAETVHLLFAKGDEEKLDLSALIHDFEIIPQGTTGSLHLPMQVRVFLGDRFLRSFRISVEVRLQQRVFVAQRYITRGEMIRPDDFKIESKLITPNPVVPELSSKSVVGLEARGRIVSGAVLRVGELADPISVNRHQAVTLMIKRGEFTLSMKGIALEKGRVGDVIRVQPGMSKSVLKARIDPEGILTVVGH